MRPRAALKEPAVVPRDDQFVYTKVVGPGGVVELSWLSVDGTRNGLTESPVNGKQQKTVQLGCVNGDRVTSGRPGVDGKPIKGGHKPIIAKKPVPMDGPRRDRGYAVHAGAGVLPGYADDGGGDGAVPGADPGDPAE